MHSGFGMPPAISRGVNLQQARTANRIRIHFQGKSYVIISARIDEHVAPRTASDGEVYWVDPADGIEMFVCWLADAPEALRAHYVRAFVIEESGYLMALSLAPTINQEVIHAYTS
jgi:hypothetical protein